MSARRGRQKTRQPRTNAELSAQTRERLLDAARHEFASAGYANAATERIVEAAGVTRGALYHHYRDKRDLFEAVVVQMQAEISARIEEQAKAESNPFDSLVVGCDAWLDACLDADVQRIVLLDAPAVLGWKRWTEIDAQHGSGGLREGIDACLRAGELAGIDAATLTHLLQGALNQVALELAQGQAEDAARLRRAAGRTLRVLLSGARAAPPARPRRRSSSP